MDDIDHSPDLSGPSGRSVRVTPVLEREDRDFLTGFAARPGQVRRVWPGQPRHASPWVPCDAGCCLLLSRAIAPVGLVGAWLRWLSETFLTDHLLSGRVEVPVRGGWTEVVLAEGTEIVEGLVEPPDSA
jgi:hypothetical protein